jgi:WhiB family redox-sensing transcriptional regulator
MENPIWFSSSDRVCASVDLQVMYPEQGDDKALAIAKSVCSECVFIDPCRDYAMRNHEQGVWGGTDERDRRSIQREITKFRRHGERANGTA